MSTWQHRHNILLRTCQECSAVTAHLRYQTSQVTSKNKFHHNRANFWVELMIHLMCVKGKGVLPHAMVVPGERGGVVPTHYQPWHQMRVSGQHHVPAVLYPREMDPQYPLDRRLGEPQSQSGRRGYKEESSASVRDRTPIIQSVLNVCILL
jgi:hypothetical protein